MGVWQILSFWVAFTTGLRWVWVCLTTNIWCLNCLLPKNFMDIFWILWGGTENSKNMSKFCSVIFVPFCQCDQSPSCFCQHSKTSDLVGWAKGGFGLLEEMSFPFITHLHLTTFISQTGPHIDCCEAILSWVWLLVLACVFFLAYVMVFKETLFSKTFAFSCLCNTKRYFEKVIHSFDSGILDKSEACLTMLLFVCWKTILVCRQMFHHRLECISGSHNMRMDCIDGSNKNAMQVSGSERNRKSGWCDLE